MAIQSFICSDLFSAFLLQNNIKPILLDSSREDFNVSLSELNKKYSRNPRIKSVLIVHTFGIINKEIKQISEWCKKNGLLLIEDCVDCAGLEYQGKMIGTFGDASFFSFFKSFNLFIGSGYVRNKGKINVVLKNYRLDKVDILRCIKLFSFSETLIKILSPVKKGLNLKITFEDLTPIAMPRISNLIYFSSKKLDIVRRREISGAITNSLRSKYNLQGVTWAQLPTDSFFFTFQIFVKNKEIVYEELLKKGIKCTKRWIDSLDQNTFLSNKWVLDQTPHARKFASRVINIVLNPSWSEKKVEKIAEELAKVILKYGV